MAATEDGETIYIYSGGFIHYNPDGTYSVNLNPVYETASEKYGETKGAQNKHSFLKVLFRPV